MLMKGFVVAGLIAMPLAAGIARADDAAGASKGADVSVHAIILAQASTEAAPSEERQIEVVPKAVEEAKPDAAPADAAPVEGSPSPDNAAGDDKPADAAPVEEAKPADDAAPADAEPVEEAKPADDAAPADAEPVEEAKPAGDAKPSGAEPIEEAKPADDAAPADVEPKAEVAAIVPTLPEGVVEPTDPTAKKAFEVLEKHCARCHQDGMLDIKKAKAGPAGKLGFILNFDKLERTSGLIVPGNPNASLLYRRIVSNEMPDDLKYDFEVPNVEAAEIEAIANWITDLKFRREKACAGREVVTFEEVAKTIAADLDQIDETRQEGTRYLTLTNLYNSCEDDRSLDAYRRGSVKLLNSLFKIKAQSADPIRLETVDEKGTIIRFNIDDMGWTASDWEDVISAYPYGVEPETSAFDTINGITKTKLAYVRADWFAFSASRPLLYNRLVGLPKTFPDLQAVLGIDIPSNVEKARVKRAGFQNSGVSQNNRMIERHDLSTGFFWHSYDFGGNAAHQSFFQFPIGPSGKHGFRKEEGFEHDGGESIFTLSNGFFAYYLQKSDGTELDKGPTNIVRDPSQRDLAVTNGISCMNCHADGIRMDGQDDLRGFVVKNPAFDRKTKEFIERRHPTREDMNKVYFEDALIFANALKRAGVVSDFEIKDENGRKSIVMPDNKLDGVEIINALSKRYERSLEIVDAAAELGIRPDELRESIAAAPEVARSVKLLDQGLMQRDTYEKVYADMVEKVLELDRVTGDGKTEVAKVEAPKAIELTADKKLYKYGEKPIFTVSVPEDCNLTLLNLDQKGTATVLFPNQHQQDNFLKAGTTIEFPNAKTPFEYVVEEKGEETVIAMCNADKKQIDGIITDFQKDLVATVRSFGKADAKAAAERAITIKKKAVETAAAEKKVAKVELVETDVPAVEEKKQAKDGDKTPFTDKLDRSAIKITVEE